MFIMNISSLICLVFLISCNSQVSVKTTRAAVVSETPLPSKICAGESISGVIGTADCSGGVAPLASSICVGVVVSGVTGTASCPNPGDPINMLSFASRKDNASFPYDPATFATFFSNPPRAVASLKDELAANPLFTANHSVVPKPLSDSDGRYRPCLYLAGYACDYSDAPEYTEKKHYLETIASLDPSATIVTRSGINVCGATGTISQRIAECLTLNGRWSYYDGKKYGQEGEGDWKQVSVVNDGGTKYEVWRDERTKLLWSDKSSIDYNWYQAAGYSKPGAVSVRETQFTSEPGVMDSSAPFNINQTMQPSNPISVCPDVIAGELAAGGGTSTYIYVNPETKFKADLVHPQVTWRLPSKNDWLLAEVNGVRKVLPNMDFSFWSASSLSDDRVFAWLFGGDYGNMGGNYRYSSSSVRCVAPSRD